MRAIIDTGSEVSIMNAETASLNGWVPQGPASELPTADGSPIKCFGIVRQDLAMTIGDATKTAQSARFIVAENMCLNIIIGIEMLRWLRILIDPEERSLVFKPDVKNIVVSREQILPARSQMVIEAMGPSNVVGAVQTIPYNTGNNCVLVANTVDTILNGKINCLIINLDTQPQKLKKGFPLASYELMVNMGDRKTVNAAMRIADSQSSITIRDELDSKQFGELEKWLAEYKQALSLHGEIGCTTVLDSLSLSLSQANLKNNAKECSISSSST